MFSKLEIVIEKYDELAMQVSDPDIIANQSVWQKYVKEMGEMEPLVKKYKEYKKAKEALEEAKEMMNDSDEEIREMAKMEYSDTQDAIETIEGELKVLMIPKDPNDEKNVILEVRAGTGGEEAALFAADLLRMYTRYAEKVGYKVEIMNFVPGDVAGIKNITVLIEGKNAYGYLRREAGVHRLVRISPFDANKRRHTSFAAVDVIPDLDNSVELDLNMDDIRVDTYRSSGAGGQHVNKTSSAIRLTHIPTGIVVTCQNERSQHKNKDMAMKILYSRLYAIEKKKNEEMIQGLRGDNGAIEWGNQIRSYVFQPYTMVKDHRTNYEVGDIIRVMNGEIDDIIESDLKNIK